uniref:CSON005241 protein n=1 Tax=Culicoides sonorensis TaxID=179676 RepID=A0A336LHC7_CULSO
MHSMGIHSALAIKRQRKRKEEAKKSRDRRYSIQSSESGDTLHSPRSSTRQKYRQYHASHQHVPSFNDTKVVTSVGMLHIGVVFLVFGVFLVGAGLIPDDAAAVSAWSIFEKDSWWNELVCTGLFAMGLGIFLIVLNGVISKREEEDLESYVARQLTRSRSGHRLERDVETGGLQTRHYRKTKENQSVVPSNENLSQNNYVTTPTTSEMVTPSTPGGYITAPGAPINYYKKHNSHIVAL